MLIDIKDLRNLLILQKSRIGFRLSPAEGQKSSVSLDRGPHRIFVSGDLQGEARRAVDRRNCSVLPGWTGGSTGLGDFHRPEGAQLTLQRHG